MRVYISGPMQGHDDYIEQFRKREDMLRVKGHDAVNPAKLSDIIKSDMKTEDWLSIDLSLIRVCDAIYMMEGWQDSKGANREYGFALGLGLKIIYEDSVGKAGIN